MTILLINHYAGCPDLGMEYRPYFMAQELKKKGHRVIIIAATYSHIRNQQKQFKNNIQTEIINEIEFVWIKTPHYNSNGLSRMWNIFKFVYILYINYKKISKMYIPDVVIASSTYPFDIFPAHRISKYTKAKLIFEIHDLWPLSPMELGGMSKYHPFILAVQLGEDFALKHSEQIISMLPNAKDYLISRGLDANKFNFVPNGIYLDDWNENQNIPQDHQVLIGGLKSEGYKLVCFAGSHGIANALPTLIEAARLLSNNKIAVILVGNGNEKKNLIDFVRKTGITNVYFLDSVAKQQIPNLLSKMDILYIGLQRQSLFRFGISPNKLFDYMMAGKPIIQSIEAGNNIVEDAKCGISIEPENASETKNAILLLLSLSNIELEKMGKNGKEYVLKNHEYSVLAQKFIEVIEKQNIKVPNK